MVSAVDRGGAQFIFWARIDAANSRDALYAPLMQRWVKKPLPLLPGAQELLTGTRVGEEGPLQSGVLNTFMMEEEGLVQVRLKEALGPCHVQPISCEMACSRGPLHWSSMGVK